MDFSAVKLWRGRRRRGGGRGTPPSPGRAWAAPRPAPAAPSSSPRPPLPARQAAPAFFAPPTTARAPVEPANTLRQMRELRRFVPALKRLQLLRVWSGIEGYIGDGQPVIGPSARVPGLHYAFGFNGEGFATSLGVGECMAELLATG